MTEPVPIDSYQDTPESPTDPEWFKRAVFYEVLVRSFNDSNDDGVGDLRGITARLDHLEWLGVDGIWLNPTFPSPNDDWGYDVSDYTSVHPDLGRLEDLDELIALDREHVWHPYAPMPAAQPPLEHAER